MQIITFGEATLFYSQNPRELIQTMGINNGYLMNQSWNETGHAVLQSIEKETIETVIVSGHPEARLDELKQSIRCYKAGGGLVINNEGEVLMIYRNEVWDLPKGKWEEGESMSECALREVEEETGVKNIELVDFIDITRHIYRDEQGWVLKETYWYKMAALQQNLVPQTEEGITKAEWVNPNNIPKYLLNTYYSIKHIFQKSGY